MPRFDTSFFILTLLFFPHIGPLRTTIGSTQVFCLIFSENFNNLVVYLLILIDMTTVIHHSVIELFMGDVVFLEYEVISPLDALPITVDATAGV